MNISNANERVSQLVGNSETSTTALDRANEAYEVAQLAVEQLGTMVEPVKDKYKKNKEELDKTDEELRSTLVGSWARFYKISFAYT